MAAGGSFMGKMTFPMGDGSTTVLDNPKDSEYREGLSAPHLLWGGANGFVAKVDMASGKAVWATDAGLTTDGDRFFVRAVATTAAGHVLTSSDQRDDGERSYKGKLAKFDGATGAKVWDVLCAPPPPPPARSEPPRVRPVRSASLPWSHPTRPLSCSRAWQTRA